MLLKETVYETLEEVKNQLRRSIQAEKKLLHSNQVVFSDSNFSELLPRPKEMDYGIFAYIFTGLDGVPGAIQLGRLDMGYKLGGESIGFMEYIGGKPYFSIAKDALTFYAGFPGDVQEYNDSLVAEYLQEISQNPEKGAYPENGLYLQDPTMVDLELRYGERAADYYSTSLQFSHNLAEIADSVISEYIEVSLPANEKFLEDKTQLPVSELSTREIVQEMMQVLEHLRETSCVHFVKAARLGFYYSQRLRLFLCDFVRVNGYDLDEVFAQLLQGLEGSAITDANLSIAAASSIEHAIEIGRAVVGHYSCGEMLEVRHQRLKDNPDALKNYVEGIFQNRFEYVAEFEKQKHAREVLQSKIVALLPVESLVPYVEYQLRGMEAVREADFLAIASDQITEKKQDLLTRLSQVDHILRFGSGKNILLITHGFFMRLLQLYFLDRKRTFSVADLAAATNYSYLDGFTVEI